MDEKSENIPEALVVLVTHANVIHTVREWADMLEYADIKLFLRHFKQVYKIAPVHMLKWIKLICLIHTMDQNREASFFDVANQIGLRDEIDLNKFVKYHLKMSPTQLRDKIQNSGKKGKNW